MIKVVLFDFGGVLTEGGKLGSVRAMFAQAYGIEPSAVTLDRSVEAAFMGTISDQELVRAINKLNPRCRPVTADILMSNADIYTRSKPVYKLAARLRKVGIVTGIFSNVFATSAARLRQTGCYDDFSPLFLSCEYRRMKPDRELYKQALQSLRVEADEVLFIDDKMEYLQPAQQLGMHTILAFEPEQIVRDVTALIATENGLHL
jgi:FMN phosphatase YigB (HAD superfamily)